ncbi:hypothetical protein EXU57_24495 [Segetibacter sp. 3557_3]|uniref:hypothetical protein n=1 Tax=Segetibacter sp. 3557_3 TaxID=2547429 RepID=UPI001058B9A8|nr:hypothetical protein [Segetibacter sp. 3557_3]TDH18037.1 hypothetical protein EXU57_24495 [Segetibacter sp. 3557_3]
MFDQIEDDPALRDKFHADPAAMAKQFRITLSDEEVFFSKTLKTIPFKYLEDCFTGSSGFAFFDNNCQCGVGGGPILT